MYKFALLDPRPIDAARETNDAVFADDAQVLGIEVTVQALAARCSLGNIDPQHTDGNVNLAAIEVVNLITVPHGETVMVTVRADLDSVGAMALLVIRDREHQLTDAQYARVKQVAEADRFARSGWPGPRPLPSSDNSWPEEGASAELSRPLAAIAAAVSDFRTPLADRVAKMEQWILTGAEPESYRIQVEKERVDMVQALESGAIKIVRIEEGGLSLIAVVESTHRAATMVGYALAPVVIALNPVFRFGSGDPHRKFTVCQFTPDFMNLRGAFDELSQLEPGWGGSPTIGGSPQGVNSTLSVEQVTRIVRYHLR